LFLILISQGEELTKFVEFDKFECGGMVACNGLVLAAWRHRSRKAFQQNKNSWKNTLSQTTSSHDAKTVLAAGA
jgi:hypothetical protein